jgi:hypothetical protein
VICPCRVTDSGRIYRNHVPGCRFSDGSICRSCGADLIHGLIVGQHEQGCELEALEKEIERLRKLEHERESKWLAP